MNKEELVSVVAEKTNNTKKKTREVLDVVFDVIYNAVFSNREEVKVNKFGIFKPTVRAARNGVNPKTKEKISIPEKMAGGFKFSKVGTDKEAVNS
jgi:DNA-binding protein HU-beta